MPGAIIPDDWDGVTFECNKIKWPSSNKWKAILLGQTSEPSTEAYWDGESGDASDAAVAVQDAYRQTYPDFYVENCDDLPNLPVVAFKGVLVASVITPVQDWITLPWDGLLWDANDPGFSFPNDGHQPIGEGHLGLWHYDFTAQVAVDPGVWFMRAVILETSVVIANTQATGLFGTISFDYEWSGDDDTLVTQVWTNVAGEVESTNSNTNYSGHYVGPTVEV